MRTAAGAEIKVVSLGATLYPQSDRVQFPPRTFFHAHAAGISVDLQLTPEEARAMGRALIDGATAAETAPPKVGSMIDPTLAPPAGPNGGSHVPPAPAAAAKKARR